MGEGNRWKTFEYAVVGNGLIGCAAARYLGAGGAKTIVIGPDEPQDWTSHEGVFASHYDSGRITRMLDTDFVWGTLAARSIERYKEIERASKVAFAHMVGCVKVVPDNDLGHNYIAANTEIGAKLGADFEKVSHTELERLFPYFQFPKIPLQFSKEVLPDGSTRESSK